MRQLLFYLILGLAAALVIFTLTRTLATNFKTFFQTHQEQRLEQLDWEQENVNKRLIEQEQLYQEQLNLIEGYSDIVTESEADYLETMGHHSPDVREQFPHVTQIELWHAVYEKELDYLNDHGRISQRILDQLKESREQAEAIERLFGNLEDQQR